MTENKFTKAFTKSEADSTNKLKEALPDILKDAGVSQDYTLWGIALNKESEDPRLDVVLVKFLRARELSLDAAKEMLTKTLAWRREFGADDILEKTFDQDTFGSVGYPYRHDKDGRPVCYNFYGGLDQDRVFGDLDKFIQWRVQLMEKCVQQVDFVNVDSIVQIHDYKDASMFGRTPNAKAAAKNVIALMQDNYPEFLHVKFFVNIPWWGSTIFKLVRPLLPESTIKKFVVCSSTELIDTLTQSINKEDLPSCYLGTESSKPAEPSNADSKASQEPEATPTAANDNPTVTSNAPAATAQAPPKSNKENSVEGTPHDEPIASGDTSAVNGHNDVQPATTTEQANDATSPAAQVD